MFKKLRVELFFISKIFRDGLVLHLFSYLKNRFFGGYLLKKLLKLEYQPDDKVELHSLCQKNDLWMLAVSLRSFLYHSDLYPSIIIHDDGSIDDRSAKLIESKFSGLKVLRKKDANKAIDDFPGLTEKVKNYRAKGHIMIMQFIDIFLLSKAENIIVYDSDLLFYKKPDEIVTFFSGTEQLDALISPQNGTYDLKMDDYYKNKYQIEEKRVGYMNPGLIVYKKEAIKLDKFLEYFDHTKRKLDDYFVGMAAWGCLVSQIHFNSLPIGRYRIKGRPDENTVMKHFTSPRRHELYAYGINMAENKIKNERFKK